MIWEVEYFAVVHDVFSFILLLPSDLHEDYIEIKCNDCIAITKLKCSWIVKAAQC